MGLAVRMRYGCGPSADLSTRSPWSRIDESQPEIVGIEASIRANTENKMSAEIGGLPPICEAFRFPRNSSIARTMNIPSHDFVTVDMRGLKAALVARAQAERVSVSVLVRGAVARELGLGEGAAPQPTDRSKETAFGSSTVKLSIRLTRVEAAHLAAGARSAGLSRGAFLAGLIAEVPVLSGGASRTDDLAALIASSAELSTLSRNIHHLTSLLREGAVRAAQEYRVMLDTLADDVHGHLALAAGVLADLRPRNRTAGAPRHPSS
ncbi:MAG: hypothetical protein ABI633_09635 [Burkholderiales bacterium]